jgi:phosphate-selective porin OprO/OprP
VNARFFSRTGLLLAFHLVSAHAVAQEVGAVATEPEPAPLVAVSYEDHALKLESRDGNYAAEVQHRFQFRYAWPFDRDPRSLSELDEKTSSFMVRRARFKLQGHAFRPWLAWYFQYDWSQPVLRDLSIEVKRYKWLRLLVGRRKVMWNDERVTSSGKQQFVNRSIANDVFTVDRQQGIQVSGRLFADSPGDLTYYAGAFAGRGVSERLNDDMHMMYAARLQWNVLGGEMEFSQSDVEFHEKAVLGLAAAGATNIADCTAFETDPRSCRELGTPRSDGRPFGDPAGDDEVESGQYRIDQLMAELRFKWRGVYAKHEFHMKRIRDRTLASGAPGQETVLRGSLTQLGWLPHGAISAVPEALELAARFAHVNPVVGVGSDWQTESSGVINWFFAGHSNKLSLEGGWLTVDERGRSLRGQTRVRAQWDISF